jgi:hypothetical protein
MASENKKMKLKNSYCRCGALKEKEMKIKRLLFYNQSKRQADRLAAMEYLDD